MIKNKTFLFCLMIVSLFIVLSLAAFSSYLVYKQIVSTAEEKILGYSRLLEQQFRRSLSETYSLLRQTESVASPHEIVQSTKIQQKIEDEIFLLSRRANIVTDIKVFDHQGYGLFRGQGYLSDIENFSLSSNFELHKNFNVDFLIGTLKQQQKSKLKYFDISKAMRKNDGSFNGVILSSIPIDQFSSLYHDLDKDLEPTFAILRHDGQYVLRIPVADGDLSRKFDAGFVQTYLQNDSLEGIAREEVGFPDGVKRLMAYRVLPEYGLVAIVAVGKDKVLSPWLWWNSIFILLSSASVIVILISYWIASKMFAHERGARHALAESNKALEGRVAERTLALHQALLQAQQAVESKSRFIAAASHDLRQPLQALRLFHSLLMSRASEFDRPLLSRMEEAMGSAESLLHSLLDVSRIESGVITPVYEEFSIGDLLSSLESEFRDQADKSGCRLRVVGTSLRVVNDRMILSRIVRNLISNAVKYGHGGRIIVGCRHNGTSARIEVWDEGPGIPADEIHLIFEEFYQIGMNEAARSKGFGLGLPIARKLATICGCHLSVRSNPRRTVFMLDLGNSVAS